VLFKPFQQNAKSTGLGLYLSRALMRSFGGDLRWEPGREGAIFIVEIATIMTGGNGTYGTQDQIAAG